VTDAAEPAAAVPARALAVWLAPLVGGLHGPLRVETLAGGSSNLTFRVRDDDHDWVLRRPPLSHVLPTANDMVREHRVQRALGPTAVPVAAMVALCEDPAVIGAPFYVMEHVEGRIYAQPADVADLSPAEARAATDELIDVLAGIHTLDWAALGLADLGRPDGFCERQVGRWRSQWERSTRFAVPAVEEVVGRLARAVPTTSRHALVHGDYNFGNAMFAPDRPARMVAVLDWEMSTLGDPLCDLGMVAVYWAEAGELLSRNRPPQAHRGRPGFPPVDVLLDRYATATGAGLEEIDFYRVLAVLKLAVICQGAYARLEQADPDRAATTRTTVEDLAALALDLAQGSSLPALSGRRAG